MSFTRLAIPEKSAHKSAQVVPNLLHAYVNFLKEPIGAKNNAIDDNP